MREETEGYAKSVTEIQAKAFQFTQSAETDMSLVDEALDTILSLIGT
jgi:hypothetical protein